MGLSSILHHKDFRVDFFVAFFVYFTILTIGGTRVGNVIKTLDSVSIIGVSGYNPQMFHRFQAEESFIKRTWPVWLRWRGFSESVCGLSCPAIYFTEEGPDWKMYEQIIPVRLDIKVVFGNPKYRDV